MKYFIALCLGMANCSIGVASGFILIPTNDVVQICAVYNEASFCKPTQGNDPVNVVVECARGGDTSIPLNVNSSPQNNPGDGMVVWMQKNFQQQAIVIDAFHFDSRNFLTFNPSNITAYFANDDVISRMSFDESCTCHATDPNAATGCPVD